MQDAFLNLASYAVPMTLAARLRALPAFPPDLPVLDADQLPDDPDELFRAWLDEAIKTEHRQPHAMDFLTARADGTPIGRTLILKDIDSSGYHFSTHRTSRKGLELAANPRASMVFFWRETGRQVRVTGTAVALDDAASQADWQARPSYDGQPNPDWQLYALEPDEFEFMQAREDRQHTRIDYTRGPDDTWQHAPVSTPAG